MRWVRVLSWGRLLATTMRCRLCRTNCLDWCVSRLICQTGVDIVQMAHDVWDGRTRTIKAMCARFSKPLVERVWFVVAMM